jgi:hypothetical protein
VLTRPGGSKGSAGEGRWCPLAHFDLVIIGTGSGNALITPDFDGKRASPLRCADCQSKGCMPVQPLPTTNPCPNEVPRPGYL